MRHKYYAPRTFWDAVAGLPVALSLPLVLLATAAVTQAQVTVAVGNGIGAPGSSASVTSTLSGGQGQVATVGYDVLFDVNVVDIQTSDCTLAPRLVPTHVLTTFLPAAGRLRLGIFDLTPPLATFDDGDLATCVFHVNAAATLGTTTQLTMQNLEVSDNSVPPVVLASTAVNGEIAVALVTPTPTNTPVGPTNTPTVTRTPTVAEPSHTPTNTVVPPTATRTPTATATRTNTPGGPTPTNTPGFIPSGGGGGCTIAPPGIADARPLAWLLVPVALFFLRRRAKS